VSVLQNYTPGNPASVLYIKNLAKDVVHDDFYYVFGMTGGDYILCFLKCLYENSAHLSAFLISRFALNCSLQDLCSKAWMLQDLV
jgi:hypothetical protein